MEASFGHVPSSDGVSFWSRAGVRLAIILRCRATTAPTCPRRRRRRRRGAASKSFARSSTVAEFLSYINAAVHRSSKIPPHSQHGTHPTPLLTPPTTTAPPKPQHTTHKAHTAARAPPLRSPNRRRREALLLFLLRASNWEGESCRAGRAAFWDGQRRPAPAALPPRAES